MYDLKTHGSFLGSIARHFYVPYNQGALIITDPLRIVDPIWEGWIAWGGEGYMETT